MKTSLKLFILTAIISLFTSCAKNPGNLLIKKEGTWTATTVTTIDSFGTFTDVYEMTFYEGSATQKDTAGNISSFNWYYNKKSSEIVISLYDGVNTTTIIEAVSNIDTDSEKWTYKSQTYNGIKTTPSGYTQETSLVRK